MRMDAGTNGGDEQVVDLPPGFRFHPTEEEIITHYLANKVVNGLFASCAIGEADLNKCEPWDLPKRAKMGEKESYFFCKKDRKYPTGRRTNRATQSGYWKATGKDKEIFQGKNRLVGMKKTLFFYKGRAHKGEKSNWVMHEFRLEGDHFSKPSKDEWVVCRVFNKTTGIKKNPFSPAGDSSRASVIPLTVSSPSFTHTEDDHDIDDGHFPSMDSNYGSNQYQYQYLWSTPVFSYMGGLQNSDYTVGSQGITNEHHLAIIQGPAVEHLSTRVSPSQETVASVDANGEITSPSAASGSQHHTSGFYASEDPISDILDYSWD